MPRSIAVVGQFAAGKSTVAEYLVEDYGYTRLSLARGIKEIGARLYNDGRPIEKQQSYSVTAPNGAPIRLSGREVLQQLGQVVKDFDRDFWLRWLAADMADSTPPFVIDDCRFPFEAEFLKSRGFVVIKLLVTKGERMKRYEATYGRLPTEAEMNHPSETEVSNIVPDHILDGLNRPHAIAKDAFSLAVTTWMDEASVA